MNGVKVFFASGAILLVLGGWFLKEQLTEREPERAPERGYDTDTVASAPPRIPELVSFDVPFTPQAPLGNWSDPRQQSGCEEAVALMAMRWIQGQRLTPEEAVREIIAISEFERAHFGHFHDTSAQDTAERIFKGFFGYEAVEVRYGIGGEDIKQELGLGNLVIVPVNGRALANPFYTPPGPLRHMLLVKGYDPATQEFITNDPGTKQGEGFRYPEAVLDAAIQDYGSGFHGSISGEAKVMIVVRSRP